MSVTIDELIKLIPTIGVELTPIIQSEPGCGKTSLLSMLKENMGDGYDYIYVDCPVKDMSDIAMTIPNHETRTLENYVGSLFKLLCILTFIIIDVSFYDLYLHFPYMVDFNIKAI